MALFRKNGGKAGKRRITAQPEASAPRVVIVDNTSPDDNWITNKTHDSVSVACEEMFGSFAVHLAPGESKRITFDVSANVYPGGQYSYEDLKYELGKGEHWEVRADSGGLFMVKANGGT